VLGYGPSARHASELARLDDCHGVDRHLVNIASLEDLSGYLGCLENGQNFKTLPGDRGVGTFGGSEDHAAILGCRKGELAQYVFCPVRHERSIALPADWTFVVASSGVAAAKTGSAREKYNHLSLATAAILDLWRRESVRADTTLLAAATSSPDAPAEIRRVLSDAAHPHFESAFLLGRFDQFFEETTRIIPTVVQALASGDLVVVGALVDRSQELAERLLGNQIPETIALARKARRLGAAAASAFGAGFGGSVWALVPAAEAADFRARWAADYVKAFPAAGRAPTSSSRVPVRPCCGSSRRSRLLGTRLRRRFAARPRASTARLVLRRRSRSRIANLLPPPSGDYSRCEREKEPTHVASAARVPRARPRRRPGHRVVPPLEPSCLQVTNRKSQIPRETPREPTPTRRCGSMPPP
jgi:hypothetical protein